MVSGKRSHINQAGVGNAALFYAFLALLVWLPVPLGSNRPWAWSVMEAWVFLLAAVWLWRFSQGKAEMTQALRRAAPVLVLFSLWLGYGLVQVIPLPDFLVGVLSPEAAGVRSAAWMPLSLDIHATLAAWLKGMAYVWIFALTLLLVSSRRRLRILAMTMVIGAMFQALFASLMVLGHWELPFLGRADVAHGTFINRNHLAGFLEMNLAVGIGLLIASLEPNAYRGSWRQRLRSLIRLMLSAKMRLRLYLVIMVIALVLTHSRMGNSAFLFSLLIAGGLALVLWRGAPRPVVILISSLILVDILIVGTWFGFDRVAKRLEETSLATEVRDEVDVYAFRLWQDFPLTGAGLGTFYAVFPRYRGEDAEGFFDHAHNDYLEILDEGGIIGLGLLGGTVVLSLAASVLAQARRRDPLLRGMGFAATMGIAALLIHSAVDFNLQIPANAATFMVVLALGWIAFGLRSRRAAGKPCV